MTVNARIILGFVFSILMVACSTAPKMMSDPMPQSGFLPNYKLLRQVSNPAPDTKMWRYRKEGLSASSYKGIIIDPVYLNQSQTKEISADALAQTKATLQNAIVEAVQKRGGLQIVTQAGPGVARVSVAITGAEVSADPIQPWNFTPIGLAAQAASHAGGINSKTPALVVENKITDSQSNEFIGGGVVVVQGESFRTGSGSVDAFQGMAKKAVQAGMSASGH